MFERFKQGAARRPAEPDKKTSDPQYHAVSLSLSANACDAAKALTGQRFLATEAPIFPLDGCNVASCTCGYKHYSDRRAGPRRSLEIGMSGQFRIGDNRRFLRDRRDEGQGESDDDLTDYFIYLSKR